jgi:membrane-associated phospholipid phosphatase
MAGFVMSARLQLQAHRPREILVGAITGFGVGFIATILLYQ